jgi:hypothetical protein
MVRDRLKSEEVEMNTKTFGFQVGAFECISISDGAFNYPPESLFANAPRSGSKRRSGDMTCPWIG